MADTDIPSKPRAPLRLLSLDGGGIRGISELLILNVIMHRVRRAQKLSYEPLPADYFDLICGTSTGGLIAILLGRLRLSVSQAIDEYRDLAKYVFSAKNYIVKDGKFKAQRLESAIKKVVKNKLRDADARMFDDSGGGCKAFVCAMPAMHISRKPSLFRTYSGYNPGYDAATIWEAARATSAAPRVFERILIGKSGLREEFIDGAMGCNNPVQILVEEASREFNTRQRVACIVSIGTGRRKVTAVDKPGFFQKVFPSQLIKALADITTSSESEAAAMEERYRNCPGLYHRLNVNRGLEEISLEEWEKLGDVKTHTDAYINDNPEVNKSIDMIVDALIGKLAQTYVLGELDGSVQPRVEEHELVIYPSFRAVNYFVERKNMLKDIKDHLESPALSSKPKVCVLQGMGGCGKSQLALEFCQRSRDTKTFATILWIDATSPSTLEQSFTDIAKVMEKPEFNPAEHEANFRFVEKRLSAQQQNWLLIFDNFDDPKLFLKNIKEYFPQAGPGSIIITTRHFGTTTLGHSLEVTRMSPDEGIKLLFERSQVPQDVRNEKEASTIIDRLGFHALAIDQAGSYIWKRHLDIASYLTHFNSRREKVLSEHPDIWDYRRPLKQDSDKETELTVFTTWELSFQLISGGDLERKDKEHILTLSAFFNINGLSDQLFYPYAQHKEDWMMSCRNEGKWDTHVFQDILTELRNLSLLQNLQIHDSALFSLHPLIQDWIKLRLSSEKRKLFAVESVIVLGDSLESQLDTYDFEKTNFQAKQVLQSHLDAVLLNKDEYRPAEDLLANKDLLSAEAIFAIFLNRQGWFKRAEEIFRTVVEGRTKLLGAANPAALVAKRNVSYSLFLQGRYVEAEPLCRETLAMQTDVLGTENMETLQSMSDLTRILRGQGKYKEAETQCRETLALQGRFLGKENTETLISMDTLGGLLQEQEKYSEAELIRQECLAISGEVLGKEHSHTLTYMINLGLVLMLQDKLDDAEPLYRESLALRQNAWGKEHSGTLTIMNNLAWLLEKKGKLEDAERLYRENLMLRDRVLGKEHPQTLTTMYNLAALLGTRGEFSEAEDLFRQVLHSQESVLGPNHPHTLASLSHLGNCLYDIGKEDEGDEVWQQYYDREKENEEEDAKSAIRIASIKGKGRDVETVIPLGRPKPEQTSEA